MDPFALTRSLVEIESVTGREKAAGEFLLATLGKLAASTGGKVERMVSMDVSPTANQLTELVASVDSVGVERRRFALAGRDKRVEYQPAFLAVIRFFLTRRATSGTSDRAFLL